jgi:uncharacterized protein YdeI (BOF family)
MRKLTRRQQVIRERYTERDRSGNVWLVIDHQSFELRTHTEGNETPAERKANAEWRRDMLAIALARLVENETK